jgi:hypothetical protein
MTENREVKMKKRRTQVSWKGKHIPERRLILAQQVVYNLCTTYSHE